MAKRHVSIRGGEWDDPATWVERRIPTTDDDVFTLGDTYVSMPKGGATVHSLTSSGSARRTRKLRRAEKFWRFVRREKWPW